MLKVLLFAAVLGIALRPAAVLCGELRSGDAAPEFDLPGSDGKTHTLSEHRGQVVVIAWFPKAFTGG